MSRAPTWAAGPQRVFLADSITAGYSQLPIVRSVSVRGHPGAITAILGPNGCGKSTLLKALVGVLKPMSGRVLLDNQDLTGLPAHKIIRCGLSYVPQLENVFPSLTVVENLEMGGFTYAGNLRQRVEAVLAAFPDLARSRRKLAGDLSVGQRNLLGIARALMLEPKVILVDEPTSGLAPDNSLRIMTRLAEVAATGVAVILVEQNVDLALEYAEWCYVLVAGQNRLEGPTREVETQDLNAIFLGAADGARTTS